MHPGTQLDLLDNRKAWKARGFLYQVKIRIYGPYQDWLCHELVGDAKCRFHTPGHYINYKIMGQRVTKWEWIDWEFIERYFINGTQKWFHIGYYYQ